MEKKKKTTKIKKKKRKKKKGNKITTTAGEESNKGKQCTHTASYVAKELPIYNLPIFFLSVQGALPAAVSFYLL